MFVCPFKNICGYCDLVNRVCSDAECSFVQPSNIEVFERMMKYYDEYIEYDRRRMAMYFIGRFLYSETEKGE